MSSSGVRSTRTTSGGLLQDPVGNGLAHGDARDARHDVSETLEMLDVERRPDADACIEQLLNVLPALRMPAVGSVGVGEFVDDDQLGLARQSRVQIKFVEGAAVIFDLTPRKDFEPFDERARFGAAMRLGKPNDNIDAFISQASRVLQHGVGLADAGRGPEENLQTTSGLAAERR
jgi:hypothetical protein